MDARKPIDATEAQKQRTQYKERKQEKTDANIEETTFITPINAEKRVNLKENSQISSNDTPKTSITDRPVTITEDLSPEKKTITPPYASLEDISEVVIRDMKTANDAEVREVGSGGFGEVTYAVVGETEETIKKYNKKKQHKEEISQPLSVSRLLVKKTLKKRKNDFDVSEDILYFEGIDKAVKESEKNKIAGMDSKPLVLRPAIVTEYKGVELTGLCFHDEKSDKETKTLSYLEKICISHQIIDSIASLHDKGIAHKDLKLANVLVGAQGITYIIDNAGITIGKPRDYKSPHKLSSKTPRYCPPEVINNNENSIYDSKGIKLSTLAHDSWSLGIMLYEIFTEKAAHEFIKRAPNNKLTLNYSDLLDAINKDVCLNPKIPTEIKEVIIGLLQYSPKARLTPREALTYDVFNNDDYKKSAFALNVEHDKNYNQLILLEKKLEKLKEANNPIEINHIRQKILTIKTRLREINVLINNEEYKDIPKDIEFECKPLNQNVIYFTKMAMLNKSIAKYKVEKKAILEDIQIYKSTIEQEISDINDFGNETTEEKVTLVQAKIDEVQDLERQALLIIESIDKNISQRLLEKQKLEDESSDTSEDTSL